MFGHVVCATFLFVHLFMLVFHILRHSNTFDSIGKTPTGCGSELPTILGPFENPNIEKFQKTGFESKLSKIHNLQAGVTLG